MLTQCLMWLHNFVKKQNKKKSGVETGQANVINVNVILMLLMQKRNTKTRQ